VSPGATGEPCQVWTLELGGLTAEDYGACRAVLSEDERARADRFYFERDREAFTAAHALVRAALTERAREIAPVDWDFEPTERGRPEVAGAGARFGLRFNLSHTRGLVGCVTAREIDCGVDLEYRGRDLRVADLETMVLTEAEQERLGRVEPAERAELFLRYWTVKEAYAKARGLGLTLPVRRVEFELGAFDGEGARPRLAADPTWTAPLSAWRFEQWRPTPHHLLAIALRPAPAGAPEVERLEVLAADLRALIG